MIERIKLPAKSRRTREHKPAYIILHGTMGQTTIDKQYQSTVNWFTHGGGNMYPASYGPSCDILIGSKGEEVWFTDQLGRDFHESRANWSAGYGESSVSTFGADEYGISIELAQTASGQSPTQATLRTAVQVVAALCVEFGIPARRITHLSQKRNEEIPGGIVGHEDTANGIKTGKWDPNKNTFPWSWFISEVNKEIAKGMVELSVEQAIDLVRYAMAIRDGQDPFSYGAGRYTKAEYQSETNRVMKFAVEITKEF